MKSSVWNFSLVLIVGLGFANAQTNNAPAAGQAPAGTPVTGSQPGTPPPGKPAIDHETWTQTTAKQAPARVLYLSLFERIAGLDQVADSQDAKGKNGDYYRAIDWKAAGLTDAEGASLNEIAKDYKQQSDALDARINAAIESHKAESPTPPKNPLSMEEFREFARERNAIVDECIDRLKLRLGDTDFAKLDAYVTSLFKLSVAQPGHLLKPSPRATPPPPNGGVQ